MDEIIGKLSSIKSIRDIQDIRDIKNFVSTLSVEELEELINLADDAYYNTEFSIISDIKYDIIKEIYELKSKKKKIGATIREGDGRPPKINIPFWLGSANKITPDNKKEWEKWIKKYDDVKDFLISDKLDGVSCLIEYSNEKITLYTRGDGLEGSDISSLSSYIKNIPNSKKINKLYSSFYVRGELIISKEDFNKYKKIYKNARNMVSGLLGSKTIRKGLGDIQFIAYEVISSDNLLHSSPPPYQSMVLLNSLSFKTVFHQLTDENSIEYLTEMFMMRKIESEFEIDGIIVQPNINYLRNTEGNPDYMMAFKMIIDENVVEVVVKNVEWNVSMHGQLKPVVIFDPIDIDGVTIKRATGHNAKYIIDNKIGKGAIIKITRSNQVIPYIISVSSPASSTSIEYLYPSCKWKWDKNKVNIISIDESNDKNTCIKLISSFFKKLKIKFVADETVKNLYNSGFDTLLKIISAEKKDFLKVERFEEKTALRTFKNIREGLFLADIPSILGASSIFGFAMGIKRMKEIFNNYPTILQEYKIISNDELYDKIINIKGMGGELTEKIVKNIKYADKFIQKLSPYMNPKNLIYKKSENTLSSDTDSENNEFLSGQIIVFTGFRDTDLENKIISLGGKVTTSVSGKTTIVIGANENSLVSGKCSEAKKRGIKIMTREQFINNFLE